ncbi:siderophore-interacting protein [Nocardioides solisilvae]|uniref:siderophore-interacting protein n=1 Tax=Nocardioides solisilvae TaxID=1542435 RepID=UPI000D74FE17|nr:siderophore-interacting protein [Nocardioides solisilvae]
MTVTAAPGLPLVLGVLEVVDVHRLSPSFVRLELGGDCLLDLGTDGPLLDQRFKLVFPAASGELPDFTGADESWFATWLAVPAEERGHMRTYTIREVRGSGLDTRIVVDVVLHVADGEHGPGSDWAAQAKPGDRVVTLAPRKGHPFGGVEFLPGAATELLLVGDETAVPAVAGILRDLPADARGAAFLEVPVEGDFLPDVIAPAGVELTWIARGDAPLGQRLHAAVVEHLGVDGVSATAGEVAAGEVAPDVAPEDVDPDLWETPSYSSSGEEVAEDPLPHEGLYAWIAGESGMVTGLRRHLVRGLGVHRRQVAFMGYWRRGVAMRS